MSLRNRQKVLAEAALGVAVFAAGAVTSFAGLRAFRAADIQPRFYQENFEPAVMMACGYGFTTLQYDTIPSSMRQFLSLSRDAFQCADIAQPPALAPVTWNGTWYYLYATTALVWRVTGLSWLALDGLVAVLGGITAAALYGLFRLVAGRALSTTAALLLTVSPANMSYVLSLRDYGKAPFVLLATLILAWLVVTPLSNRALLGMAALVGAILGFGYGFRTDLMIFAPFAVLVLLFLLPGSLRTTWKRRITAVALFAVVFLLVARPALQGLKTGGCQFHYSLLGLTSPLRAPLGVEGSLYEWGDHFLDTFVDLKVGDYAHRMFGGPPPTLCSLEYDRASGEIFRRMTFTFPADLVLHAYGSVLTILRNSFVIPPLPLSGPPFPRYAWAGYGFLLLNKVTRPFGLLGPVITVVAVVIAWVRAPRFGLALAAFVLFLAGYPAIEFEARHWFHLRFIPWWAAAYAGRELVPGVGDWSRSAIWRALAGVTATAAALGLILAGCRLFQTRAVAALIRSYESAGVVELPVSRSAAGFVRVDWSPDDYGDRPNHRSSDLLQVTVDSARCAQFERLAVRARYDADGPAHDMSSTIAVDRGGRGAVPPTLLFVPVFAQGFQDHTYLRFSGFEVIGAPADCVTRVARTVDRLSPLWMQVQIPSNWPTRRLYQTFQTPAFLR